MVAIKFLVNIYIILLKIKIILPKLKNNIILIGPMGSGKTSIGKKLSKLMSFDFIDTDALIEEKTGADISTIFEHEGEVGFRNRESKILEEIMSCKSTIVGTGGGIILSKINFL